MKNRRIFAVILAAVMLLALVPFSAVSAVSNIWDGSFATEFASGSGTESDPYIITNGAELAYLSDFDTEGLYFELANDIVLSDTSSENWFENAIEWPYISFYGNFNGNGHTITGLCVNPETLDGEYENVGLFSDAQNATIQNVNLEDVYLVGIEDVGGIVGDGGDVFIYNCSVSGVVKSLTYEYEDEDEEGNIGTSGGGYVGGIAGYLHYDENGSRVENCTNNADVYGDRYDIGGIVGYGSSYSEVVYCVNNGNVTGSDYLGGIAGELSGNYWEDDEQLTIEYEYDYVNGCVNYGDVISYDINDYVGGIVGCTYASEIEEVVNYGSVCAGSYVGGIAGYVGTSTTIIGGINYGDVDGGSNYAGGIAGYAHGYMYEFNETDYEVLSVSIVSCANRGDVVALSNYDDELTCYTGGICGYSDNYVNLISNYNYGYTYGDYYVGGIAGYGYDNFNVVYCYNGGEINAVECVGGILGYAHINDSQNAQIRYCTNNGSVSGIWSVSGIAGYMSESTDVQNCLNKGNVKGICCVGGIAGYGRGGYIENCLNKGTLDIFADESYSYCPCGGGIIGEANNTEIYYCVSVGSFDCVDDAVIGGIGCSYYEGVYLLDCYYLASEDYLGFGEVFDETTGNYEPLTSELEGVHALSAEEMKDESSFDLNFENTWTMGAKNPELVDAAETILADANMDGVVDMKDYALVKRACFGTAEIDIYGMFAADLNGDSVVDMKDYAAIKRVCFGTMTLK